MDVKRIIMCGSRTWPWASARFIGREILRLRTTYADGLVIVHGDEPNGADELIRRYCNELGVTHEQYCAGASKYPAHGKFTVFCVSSWNTQGKAAGPIRNKAMLDSGASGCVAFRAEGKSNGTDGMIRLCADAGIPRIVYMADGTRHISK